MVSLDIDLSRKTSTIYIKKKLDFFFRTEEFFTISENPITKNNTTYSIWVEQHMIQSAFCSCCKHSDSTYRYKQVTDYFII